MLSVILDAHLGIESRARHVLFWPGTNVANQDKAAKREISSRYGKENDKEPLKLHEIDSEGKILL